MVIDDAWQEHLRFPIGRNVEAATRESDATSQALYMRGMDTASVHPIRS